MEITQQTKEEIQDEFLKINMTLIGIRNDTKLKTMAVTKRMKEIEKLLKIGQY